MIPASFAPMILKLVFPKLEKKMNELRLDIVIDELGKIKKWNAEIKSDLKVYVDLTMKGK